MSYPGQRPARRPFYCSTCGGDMSVGDTHGCFVASIDPRSPFCGKCGKTLRSGFIKRATCACWEVEK